MKPTVQIHAKKILDLIKPATDIVLRFTAWANNDEHTEKYSGKKGGACKELEDFIIHTRLDTQELAELEYALDSLLDVAEHLQDHIQKNVIKKADVEFIDRKNPLHENNRH